MKNLKHIDEFINESWIDPTEKLKLDDKIEYDEISSIINDYVVELSPNSFDVSYYRQDGEKDLKGLKKYLDENSSKNNILDYFFKKYRTVIYNDENFISQNGFYDYMLYTYDKSYMLNGGGVGPESEDKMYKYLYGFQTTKLGNLFIKQNFDTMDNFYKECAKAFPDYFFYNFIFNNQGNILYYPNYKDYTIIDNNVCIIGISFINNMKNFISELDNMDKTPPYLIDDGIFITIFCDDNLNIEDEIIKYKTKHKDIIEKLKMKYTMSKYNL